MAPRNPASSTASSKGPASGTSAEHARPRRRIVVGLDTNFMAREALSLAARLAASVEAGLRGVFVEDENLIALSALPFAVEYCASGQVQELDPEKMLRSMRAQAESTRRILARVADEAHIEWSFDIARGRPLAALASAVDANDTLVIRSQKANSRELGRALRSATREIRADVLLAAHGVGVSGAFFRPATDAVVSSTARPLAAIDEGSSLGEACSIFAETLAQRIGAPFRRIFARGFAPADVAVAARNAGAGLIVVNADWFGDDDDAARLSAAAGCPVLLLGAERQTTDDTT